MKKGIKNIYGITLFLTFLFLLINFSISAEENVIPHKTFQLDKEYDFSPNSKSNGEEEAEQFAVSCDEATRSDLIAILQDEKTDNDYNKCKIAFYLGKTKDKRVGPICISRIEKCFSLPFSTDVRLSLNNYIGALGFLGDENSLNYLRKMLTPEYWNTNPITFSDEVDKNTKLDIVRSTKEVTLLCMGLSGTENAERALDIVRDDPSLKEFYGKIDGIKAINRERMNGEHIKNRTENREKLEVDTF